MMRQVSMLDLKGEHALFADEVRRAVEGVLESRQFINGPPVGALETELAGHVGVAHAVAVSSGTDALLCTLMALDVGPGDEVIVPSFTFFATAGCVARVGAKPVFVDIDPRTFNMDPATVETAITQRTRAIIPVHLFGQCAEMDALVAVASRHGVKVIEDAAQALGAAYHGRQACGLADAACVSFYPTKNLGGIGEGGMIFTDDERLAAICRQLRNHGESGRYLHERVGGNFRLASIQAAALSVKLRFLGEFTTQRIQNADRYAALLGGAPVTTPHVAGHQKHVFHQYSILCDDRDALRAYLGDRGVQSGLYYPVGLHLQTCFAPLGYATGSLPVTERTCRRIVSLPCHPMLSEDDLTYVSSCVDAFFKRPNKSRSSTQAARGAVV